MTCLGRAHYAEAATRSSAIIPDRFLGALPGTATASTNAIFTHPEDVQLEQSENQIVREGEAHRVSGLLLHHVTEETKVWMLHFQRELSVLRFTTCQEKG